MESQRKLHFSVSSGCLKLSICYGIAAKMTFQCAQWAAEIVNLLWNGRENDISVCRWAPTIINLLKTQKSDPWKFTRGTNLNHYNLQGIGSKRANAQWAPENVN